MDPLEYSWLAIAAAACPLTVAVAATSAYIQHTYRRTWGTVDLLVLAATIQGVLGAIFTLAVAIVTLVGPRLVPLCVPVVWGVTAVRTLHVLTLTSMAVDRALTVRWPYTYRASVRTNQVRYHISVLAVIAVFVGVAAIFARNSKSQHLISVDLHCSTYPQALDIKFSLFVVCFYGFLTITTLVAILQILVSMLHVFSIKITNCWNHPSSSSRGLSHKQARIQTTI